MDLLRKRLLKQIAKHEKIMAERQAVLMRKLERANQARKRKLLKKLAKEKEQSEKMTYRKAREIRITQKLLEDECKPAKLRDDSDKVRVQIKPGLWAYVKNNSETELLRLVAKHEQKEKEVWENIKRGRI